MARIEPASFRDPEATVFVDSDRVFRGLSSQAADSWRAASESGLLEDLVAEGLLVAHQEAPEGVTPPDGVPAALILEARRVPVVSYPYEWSFSMLRDAALATIDVTARSLEAGFQMKDASGYNVLFDGAHPLLIDVTSIDEGFDGYWTAYGQFCDHFLAPLLLEARLGIHFQPYLRGRLDGLPVTDLAAMLKGIRRFGRGVPSHVLLRSRIEKRARLLETADRTALRRQASLPRQAVQRTLGKMRKLVSDLSSDLVGVWTDYEATHSYDQADRSAKEAFVKAAARAAPGKLAWDVGANTGFFSELLAEFYEVVVALDSDAGAVDAMYRRLRQAGNRRILPLVVDITDPSPNRGWRGAERRSLAGRSEADFATWLAVIHHVCIAGEVPIGAFLDLVAETSPRSVVEFVAPDDPMAQRLLATRSTLRSDYSAEAFQAALADRFVVLETADTTKTRRLFHLQRL